MRFLIDEGTSERRVRATEGTAHVDLVIRPDYTEEVFFGSTQLPVLDSGVTLSHGLTFSHGLRLPPTPGEWLRDHQSRLTRYRGKWVAITGKGVIAESDDFDDVYKKAESLGEYRPLVFKVPMKEKLRAVSAHKK